MLSPREEDLLKKLEAGLCPEEEMDEVFSIVRKFPKARAEKVMEQLWKQSRYRKVLPQTTFAAIEARIRQQGTAEWSPRRRNKLLPWLAAASVLLLLTAGMLVLFNQSIPTTTTTAYAEQKTITLPDGSTVWLNANSTLTYTDDWDEYEDREVTLDGEAFFQVSSKPATGQKFTVTTADLTVAVLGTIFNVNSREEQTSVFLEEGSISLQLKEFTEPEKVMEPGELVTYSAKRREMLADVKAAKPEVHTSWKDGVLVFEDTPLAEVLEKVENIYGITFEVADSAIYDREITAGLPMEEISIVMPLLEQVLGYPIKQVNDNYRIME